MINEEMLNCENPANLNAVMFSRHFLGCNVVFIKIRLVLLFEVSPVQIVKQFQLSDKMMIGELYRQFVTINPFMLQVVQVLLSNHIQVIPYEYENEYFTYDEWDKLILQVGYPEMGPAFVFPKIAEDRDKVFLQYATEDEKVGFISTKPLSLTKSFVYPFRVFPILNKMHYSYRATISNKRFQVLYENFVNHTLLHGVLPKTKAYALGFAKIGPLHFMLCKMIHQKISDEKFDRVYFMPHAYLLFLCYQKLYPSEHYAAMSGDRREGSKVLFVDFGIDKSPSKEMYHNSNFITEAEVEFFKWKVPYRYRKAFDEMLHLLSYIPFDLTDCTKQTSKCLPYPKSPLENKILCDIYKGTEEFVEKFHQYIPEAIENNLGPFYYKDGFELYLQEMQKKKKFSLYGWLKKNKLVRRVYSRLKRILSAS